MYPDRVITVKGTIENMSAAEASISQKLRECIEKEMQVGFFSNFLSYLSLVVILGNRND